MSDGQAYLWRFRNENHDEDEHPMPHVSYNHLLYVHPEYTPLLVWSVSFCKTIHSDRTQPERLPHRPSRVVATSCGTASACYVRILSQHGRCVLSEASQTYRKRQTTSAKLTQQQNTQSGSSMVTLALGRVRKVHSIGLIY